MELSDNWTSGPTLRLSSDQLAELAELVEAGPDREVDGVVCRQPAPPMITAVLCSCIGSERVPVRSKTSLLGTFQPDPYERTVRSEWNH